MINKDDVLDQNFESPPTPEMSPGCYATNKFWPIFHRGMMAKQEQIHCWETHFKGVREQHDLKTFELVSSSYQVQIECQSLVSHSTWGLHWPDDLNSQSLVWIIASGPQVLLSGIATQHHYQIILWLTVSQIVIKSSHSFIYISNWKWSTTIRFK